MAHYLKTELYELIKNDESVFEFFLDGSLDGLWYWDLENPENEWMNARFWEVLGYNPEKMPHKASAWQGIINQDDLKIALENFHKHLADPNHPYDQEVRYTHKNGSTVWVRCRGLAIRNKEGKAIRMVGVHQDITHLKNVENELRKEHEIVKKNEELFRFLTENSSDIIRYQKPSGKFNYVSPNIELLTGYTSDEYIKFGSLENVVPDDHSKLMDAVEKFRSGLKTLSLEYRIYHKTGRVIWLESRIQAIYNDNNELVSLVSSSNDITEQKQAEKKILDSLNLLNSFINNFPDDAWVKDIKGNITVANQYVKDNTFGSEDVIGKTVYDFFPPEIADECWKSEQKVIAGDETIRIEEQIPQIDGIHSKILTKFPLHDVNGEVVGIGAIAHDITTQKLYSQELVKSEKRYRELVDTLNSGVAIYQVINCGNSGSDYIIQDFNQFALQHEQCNRDYVIGKSLKDIRPKIDEYGLINVFKEVWETGEPKFFPAKVYTDDKYANYYENRVFRLPSKEIVAIYDDVTERESARLKLADSEQKLKNIIENSTNLFFAHSADHRMTFISPQVKDFLGYDPDEVMTDWTQFITDSHINEKAIEYTQKAIETGIQQPTYEMEMLRKDGKKIIVEVREAPVLENGKVVSIVGSLADVTDRKEAEQQIIQQNEEYEALNEELQQTNTQLSSTIAREASMIDRFDKAMEASSDGIFDWNLKTNEIYYSPRWKSLLGYKDNELPNDISVWEKLIYEKDAKRFWKMFHDLIDKKIDKFDMEFIMKHKDGRLIDIHSRADLFLDDSGQANRVVGTHTDVTKRKQAEYELRVAKEKAEESDKLKSAFLANMSHEIRTPMNGILGFADLLKRPDLKSESHQKYISVIEESGKRMLNIINDIIDISKIEAGLMELSIKKTNVNEQIDYVHTFFKPEAEAKGLRISILKPLSVNEAFIYTDSEKLYAILTNLIKNAIKYTNQGAIEFGYRVEKLKNNPVDNTDQFDAILEFFVKDTGIGIPPDRQQAIFERFIQADIEDKMAHQGAGLGLTITKNYVEKLGGKIWVESDGNHGSVFYFTVPYNIKPDIKVSTEIKPELSFKQNKIKALKVLIAEDDAISEMFMSEIIAPYSKELIKAGNGIEAVDLCRKNPDIDLVLMDIRMPLMDGYEAVKSIREFNKKVVIIAQTAYGLTGDSNAAINAGCNDYLSKPINKTFLHELLNKYFPNKTQ